MKKLAIIRKTLMVALLVLVGLAGFGLGRLTAPVKSPDQQLAPDNTIAPLEAATLPESTPKTSTPAPGPEQTAQPTPAATGEAKPVAAYVLKRDGNGLVVLKNEVIVAAFSAEWSQLPDQVKTQLETGIMFESLDDIESYLEDYES